MAHPWIFESNFETGSNSQWDSESDTGSKIDFPHYSVLASVPGSLCAPWRGAYCMRIQMGDTNDHTLIEADMDIADGSTAFASFYLYLGEDVAATADDVFNIFEFQQAGGTVEASVGLRITASTDAVEIGIGDGTATTDYSAALLEKNRWYHIEVGMAVSTTDVGTLTLYVDGASRVALTALDHAAAVGRGVLGTQDTLSTTTGTLLFDRFIFDDLQVYPARERFPRNVTFTQSGHMFVGPGTVDSAALLSTTAGDILRLYDTDTANVNDAQGFKIELANGNLTASSGPIVFTRGCYVQLTGTNSRGQVTIMEGDDSPGSVGPRYYSAWGIRYYGQRRKPRANNA